ncbi:MAG: phosphatidylserine decarboxylase family protein [DPANN group archaeon]|nr:phosphatidylserine decarboxylase family protein [DPANN group archaeon]
MGILLLLILFLLVLTMGMWLFYRYVFLRNPVRTIPPGDSIVSPADGIISSVIRTGAKDLSIPKGHLGRIRTYARDVAAETILVLIVMNLWHVHYQRAPIHGKIIKQRHRRGKFRNAVMGNRLRCLFENEKNEFLITNRAFKVKVIQIAGILARRIVPMAKVNEKVMKGQVIGLIRLGSQVALIMPSTVRLRVEEGQPVKAGETIIGVY